MRAPPFCWAALLAVVCGAGPAQASIVHRCRQTDGVIAYRDTGCSTGEISIARLELAEPPSMDSSAHDAAMVPASSGRTTRTPRNEAAPAALPRSARDAVPHRAQAPDRIVAHECRFGEQRWVQAAACPATLSVAAPHGAKPTLRRVEETRLTADRVCGALRATSAAQASGAGSARRAYGMNRLRQQHGC
jgi:hypothetical protein